MVQSHDGPDWRGALKRNISLTLLAKVFALAVLYLLFFSPSHRTPVDAQAAAAHLSGPTTDTAKTNPGGSGHD